MAIVNAVYSLIAVLFFAQLYFLAGILLVFNIFLTATFKRLYLIVIVSLSYSVEVPDHHCIKLTVLE